MDIKTINQKIDKLNQLEADLIKEIAATRINIDGLKQQINQLETTKTIKGAEVRQVIKELNRKKTELSSRKHTLNWRESDLNMLPYKIKRYERIKNKMSKNIFDYIESKIQKKD